MQSPAGCSLPCTRTLDRIVWRGLQSNCFRSLRFCRDLPERDPATKYQRRKLVISYRMSAPTKWSVPPLVDTCRREQILLIIYTPAVVVVHGVVWRNQLASQQLLFKPIVMLSVSPSSRDTFLSPFSICSLISSLFITKTFNTKRMTTRIPMLVEERRRYHFSKVS